MAIKAAGAQMSSAAATATLSTDGLATDGTTNPLGIDDATPTLRWALTSTDRNVTQTKYRLLVATSLAGLSAAEGDLTVAHAGVWDSGDVFSSDSSAAYTGPALASRTRYYWSVRVAGKVGVPVTGGVVSAWSDPAWFETAYLSPSLWQGSWISGPPRQTTLQTAAQGAADDVCCLQASTTLAAASAAGATNIKVASVAAMAAGLVLTIDTGAAQESATVASVGTAPATSTTLVVPAAAGDTTVDVASVTGYAVGAPITVDTGAAQESATISAVGTAQGAATTLFAAAAIGDTNVKVQTTSGFAVGQKIVLDSGASLEAPTVTTIGTAGTATTLSSASAVGVTNIKVASVTNLAVGDTLTVDNPANVETRTITAVGTSGAGGTGVTLNTALSLAHASGATVRDQSKAGTGITFAPALTMAHAIGTSVRGAGSGISFTPALTAAHAVGAAVSSLGTGITLTGPLANAHAQGAAVVGPVPRDICRPIGSYTNGGQCAPIRPTEFLRKAFTVDPVIQHGPVVSARVYSSGLGWDNMTLNGSKTEPNAFLNPGFTAYDQTVLYDTDDVTSLIHQDPTAPTANVIAAELAAGRYDEAATATNHAWSTAQWRAEETLRADLYVTYQDGTQQLIKSDDSWKASIDGPTRAADYDLGEIYDSRQVIPGWDTASYDASAWGAARLVPGPAGRVMAQKEPLNKVVTVHPNTNDTLFPQFSPATGQYAWDVLKQYTGFATLKIWGATPGQVIRIVFIERRNATSVSQGVVTGPNQGALVLPDSFGTSTMSQMYYVSNGSGTSEDNAEVYTPHTWFGGFQWILVTGSNNAALPSNVHVMVTSVSEMHTAMDPTGTFTSDNPLLNSIYTAVNGSAIGDYEAGQSMDTPTYEKDGWTGDTQLMAPTVSLMYDTQTQYQKSSQDVVDSQKIGDAVSAANTGGSPPMPGGQVGLLIPSGNGYGYCSPTGTAFACGNSPSSATFKGTNVGATPIWDAWLHVAPWTLYQDYNDTSGLQTAFPAMKKYLDTWIPYWFQAYHTNIDPTKNYLLNSGLGDWDVPTGSTTDATPGENTNFSVPTIISQSATAYVAYEAKITADSARALSVADPANAAQYTADAAQFDTMYDNIKADYNAKFWNAAAGYYQGDTTGATFTQGAQIIPLAFGFVSDADRIPLETKLVNDVVNTRHNHEEVGIAAARWFFPVLSQAAHDGVPGAGQAAYAVALQNTYPSFGYEQKLGWTGIGEDWESSSRTRDHQMFGTIGQWMYEGLAGIKSTSPGYGTVEMKPLIVPNAGINHAAATYQSIHGQFASSWTQDSSGITLHVTIPPNTTADVYVPASDPDSVSETGSGSSMLAAMAPGVALVEGPRPGHVDSVEYAVKSGDYTFVVSTNSERLAALKVTLGAMPSFAAQTGLLNNLTSAQSALATGGNACTPLNTFLTTVINKTPAQLTTAQATTLLDGANAVVISLNCPGSSVARAQAEDDSVALIGQIGGMPLSGGVDGTLVSKTQAAGAAIVAGTGCPQLAELQSQITTYTTGGKLTAAQGAALTTSVGHIQTELGC